MPVHDKFAGRGLDKGTILMSADSELMLYKCGVLDGLRLAKLLLELE